MKQTISILVSLVLLVAFTGVNGFAGYDSYKVTKKESIEKTLSFPAGAGSKSLVLENVFGYIKVTGYNGSTVQLKAAKLIRAKTQEKLENAQKEVKLDITTKGSTLNIIVDGPFRCDEGHIHWDSKKRGYIVKYDFELKVPREIALTLKTVNEGDIHLSGTHGACEVNNVNGKIMIDGLTGDFDVHTVNGPITMAKILGSGEAHTVNGKVKVDFVKNPASDCSFHTINGKLDIDFRGGLSADFQLKTFNGKIYSDFPSTLLPMKTSAEGKRVKGKYIYKSNEFQGVRIGKGGPVIKMDTLNGNIYINKGE